MLRRLLALLAVTIGLIVTVVSTSTTTAGAATLAYDAPAIERVCAHKPGPAEIGLVQLSGSRAGSALPPVAARGVSTTPTLAFVATNAADDFANWGGEFVDDAIRAPATRPDLANISAKIERQMQTRGWTPDLIDEAVTSGSKFPAVNKLGGANTPATRYVSPTTGQSVVIDNATGEIIQVGGPDFKYGP